MSDKSDKKSPNINIPNTSLKQAIADVLNKRNLSKPFINAKDAIDSILKSEKNYKGKKE